MTRRLCIVNLSNWDGEDYEVAAPKDDYQSSEKTVLKPGEHLNVYPHQMTPISVSPVESKKPGPLRDESGVQVVPQMKVEFQ